MLTAAEAAKLAKENDATAKVLEAIASHVYKAASEGKNSTSIYMPRDPEKVKAELKKLGYGVVLQFDPRGGHDDYMKVMW